MEGGSVAENERCETNEQCAGDLFCNADPACEACYGDEFRQVEKLVAHDAAAGDNFGDSVAISGDLIVVGAHLHDDAAGSAYVFGRTDGGKSWYHKLVANDAASPGSTAAKTA